MSDLDSDDDESIYSDSEDGIEFDTDDDDDAEEVTGGAQPESELKIIGRERVDTHVTSNRISKFERANLISARAALYEANGQTYIEDTSDLLPEQVAEKEHALGKLPYIIYRDVGVKQTPVGLIVLYETHDVNNMIGLA